MRAIRAAGITLNGPLHCVFTVDEEKNGPDGSIFLLDEKGLKADCTIVCEPTGWTQPDGRWGMGVAVANCGNFLVEIVTCGIKTHLWRPDTGVNAVSRMAQLLTRFETMSFQHHPAPRAGGTVPMATVLRVSGGIKREMQFTPDVATAVLGIVGEAPALYRKNAFNDTIRFAERGHKAITFGPGEDGWPPVNEWTHIPKAVAATRVLALTILDILGTKP